MDCFGLETSTIGSYIYHPAKREGWANFLKDNDNDISTQSLNQLVARHPGSRNSGDKPKTN